MPPRHQNVELIKSPTTNDDRTEPPLAGGGQAGEGGARTVMFAVTAGIAIGVGLSLAAIFFFQ